MSFENLNKDELTKVARFFNKDVKAEDEDKGPTKKELVEALESDADGADAVTWDDYKNVYLESDEKKAEEQEEAREEAAARSESDTVGEPEVSEDDEDEILVKMERKNGTFETHGLRFTKAHPFKSVKASVAESIIQNVEGFRQALPSEVKDYYN